MKLKIFRGRSVKDLVIAIGPTLSVCLIAILLAYKFVDPAPPKHFVMQTSTGEGDFETYAKLYKDIMKDDGVDLEIRTSNGAVENYDNLKQKNSDVDVAFVQDGVGSPDEAPNLSSLGSMYYEPLWVFYKSTTPITRFSQFKGKRVSLGRVGGGTFALATKLLTENGVTAQNTHFASVKLPDANAMLMKGQLDAVFILGVPSDPLIKMMSAEKSFRIMNVDQAEAISRQLPYLHHLVLPHGALDLEKNIPNEDVNLIAPTATLLARDDFHPALIYLLLKAASQVHSDPGIFEKAGEFPQNKDYQFPLADEAKDYYKSGGPFWQRYLPFWLATLVDRFFIVMIPLLALIIPIIKLVPKILDWRVKSRLFKRYGELKFLEARIRHNPSADQRKECLSELDHIEERVNHMKMPLDYSDHIYVLREHIDFVRDKIRGTQSQS